MAFVAFSISDTEVNHIFRNFDKTNLMLAVGGIYDNGYLKLDSEITASRPVRVIITFLDEVESVPSERLSVLNFSFAASRKEMMGFNGSFCNELLGDRRREL